MENAENAIVRPEFVKITKKGEFQKFRRSCSKGIVESTAFRGGSVEITVRVNDILLTARRGLDEKPVSEGEEVDVFVYRMFVTSGDKAYLLENESLKEESVFI